MGETSEISQQMSKDAQYPVSLNIPISVEGDSVLGDYIEAQAIRRLSQPEIQHKLLSYLSQLQT